jgi:hypothetical protein
MERVLFFLPLAIPKTTPRMSDGVAEAGVAANLENIFRRERLRPGDVLNKHGFTVSECHAREE